MRARAHHDRKYWEKKNFHIRVAVHEEPATCGRCCRFIHLRKVYKTDVIRLTPPKLRFIFAALNFHWAWLSITRCSKHFHPSNIGSNASFVEQKRFCFVRLVRWSPDSKFTPKMLRWRPTWMERLALAVNICCTVYNQLPFACTLRWRCSLLVSWSDAAFKWSAWTASRMIESNNSPRRIRIAKKAGQRWNYWQKTSSTVCTVCKCRKLCAISKWLLRLFLPFFRLSLCLLSARPRINQSMNIIGVALNASGGDKMIEQNPAQWRMESYHRRSTLCALETKETHTGTHHQQNAKASCACSSVDAD